MARSYKKRFRKYRSRRKSSWKRRKTFKIATKAVKSYMKKNAEMLSTSIKHEIFQGDASTYELCWRPIDPPFAQGDKKYVAAQGPDTWGNHGSLTGYTTSEANYACITGNKLRKVKSTVKIEAEPRVILVNTVTGGVTVLNLFDFGTTSPIVTSVLQTLRCKVRVWVVCAPKGRTDTQLLNYLDTTYNCSQVQSIWGVTGNPWDIPVDRTHCTILKQKEFMVSLLQGHTIKMSLGRAKGTYILPTDGSGALEDTRPSNGKKFIVFFIGGTARFTDTNPTPDIQYSLAPNIAVTFYNTYADF